MSKRRIAEFVQMFWEFSRFDVQQRMTAMELKSDLRHGHRRNIRVKEIREALKEMEKA
ncbi:MAG: hypothetical protein WBG50_15970 [Desulfomonilaceae bacterium]